MNPWQLKNDVFPRKCHFAEGGYFLYVINSKSTDRVHRICYESLPVQKQLSIRVAREMLSLQMIYLQ